MCIFYVITDDREFNDARSVVTGGTAGNDEKVGIVVVLSFR